MVTTYDYSFLRFPLNSFKRFNDCINTTAKNEVYTPSLKAIIAIMRKNVENKLLVEINIPYLPSRVKSRWHYSLRYKLT